MKATRAFIEELFNKWNERAFGGELPLPTIRMSSARTFLGQMGWRTERTLLGGTHNKDFTLKISTRYDQTEDEITDTLLHEMIHYYIAYRQLKDSSTHGPLFRRLMADINHRFQRHLTISHQRTEAERQQDTQRRQHLVCVSTFKDGRQGITIATRTSLFHLWDHLPQIPDIMATQWYSTTDSYFNRFPRSRTLRVYKISPADLQQHLKGALPLKREGNTIRVDRPSEV